MIGIPNPIRKWASLEEAEAFIGFALSVPDIPEDYDSCIIHTISTRVLELRYRSETDEINIRKAAGSEDISGDYNVYEQESRTAADGFDITVKSSGTNCHLAVWANDGYTYAVSSRCGTDLNSLLAIVNSVR